MPGLLKKPKPPLARGSGESLADLSALYEAHLAMVWRSLSALGVPPASLDDAVQDVFLVAYRREHEFEGRSSVKTWLFGIAYRVAANYRRSVRRQNTCELPTTLPCPQPNQEERLQRAEAGHFVQQFLEGLNEASRAAFTACVLEGMTIPEAAEALGVNAHTLYSRVRVARARFMAALAAKGIQR